MLKSVALVVLGSLATVLAVALAGARAPLQGYGPPEVGEGSKLYYFQTSRSTKELFPSLAFNTPVEVHRVVGNWALVEVVGFPKGRFWVNFDHVITYKTSL